MLISLLRCLLKMNPVDEDPHDMHLPASTLLILWVCIYYTQTKSPVISSQALEWGHKATGLYQYGGPQIETLGVVLYLRNILGLDIVENCRLTSVIKTVRLLPNLGFPLSSEGSWV